MLQREQFKQLQKEQCYKEKNSSTYVQISWKHCLSKLIWYTDEITYQIRRFINKFIFCLYNYFVFVSVFFLVFFLFLKICLCL